MAGVAACAASLQREWRTTGSASMLTASLAVACGGLLAFWVGLVAWAQEHAGRR